MIIQSQVWKALQKFGWAKANTVRHGGGALRRYQKWAGLKVDGKAGPVTRHSLSTPRLCGTPDQIARGQCKWPMKSVSWSIKDSLPGVPDAAYKEAAHWATRQWNEACGVKLQYKQNHRTANVWMTVKNLGGPGGVLADSQLPCGATATSQMIQRYDSSELWFAELGQPPQGRISLPTVCVHELGHAIGISHLPPNGQPAIMQPFYNPSMLSLLGPDIEEARDRYGSSDINPPPSAGGYWVTVRIQTDTEPTTERIAG